MSEYNFEKPRIISALYLLFISYGIILIIRAVVNVFQTQPPILPWTLIIGSFAISVFNSGLVIAAGVGVMKKLRWGWWLAGIFLSSSLLGSILVFVQLYVSEINGERLYILQPGLLIATSVTFIASIFLLLLLFTKSARDYLSVSAIKITTCFAKLLGFGLLLLFLNAVLIFLVTLLNVLIN